jgi:hypothetical protein
LTYLRLTTLSICACVRSSSVGKRRPLRANIAGGSFFSGGDF